MKISKATKHADCYSICSWKCRNILPFLCRTLCQGLVRHVPFIKTGFCHYKLKRVECGIPSSEQDLEETEK